MTPDVREHSVVWPRAKAPPFPSAVLPPVQPIPNASPCPPTRYVREGRTLCQHLRLRLSHRLRQRPRRSTHPTRRSTDPTCRSIDPTCRSIHLTCRSTHPTCLKCTLVAGCPGPDNACNTATKSPGIGAAA